MKNSFNQSRERGRSLRGDAARLQHDREPPHVIGEGLEDSELQSGSEELKVVADIFPGRRAAALPESLVEGREGLVEPADNCLYGLVVQGEETPQPLWSRKRALFLFHVSPISS